MNEQSNIARDALTSAINHFDDAQVLCVGDVMLDRFVYGHVDRISPEAPIPVVKYDHENRMLGGAGNVVRNISSLGGATTFVSVIGKDEIGNEIVALTGEQERVFPYILTDKTRTSTEKTRYIAGSQQLFRADREHAEPLSESMSEQILAVFEDEVAKHKVVVLSDYGKGMMNPDALRRMTEIARENDVAVIIDPKSSNFGLYRGATLVTPNLAEMERAADEKLETVDAIEKAAKRLMQMHKISNMLITRGAGGMVLISENDAPYEIDARAREVFDVSGAGDTVVATLAVAMAGGCSIKDAAFLANAAGGIVVGKIGTAVVYRTDLKAAIHTLDIVTGKRKIFPQDIAADQVDAWQRAGEKVGFTNGCFDIVHSGHLASLNAAKSFCDKLVLAINADKSVKRLKGEERPINGEMDRALLLAELRSVDMVVIFREDTPETLLEKLRPDVLMKGEDYQKHEIVGWEFVESYGGEIKRIPLQEGYSTTNTIQKIRSTNS